MDDAVRRRITADVVEVSRAVGGGDLYVRYDAETHFGDMCFGCGAVCGVEECTCTPPQLPGTVEQAVGTAEDDLPPPPDPSLGRRLPEFFTEAELEDFISLLQPKRPPRP